MAKNAKVVMSNRMNSAKLAAKGMSASNTKTMPVGTATTPPPKTAPKTSSTSAIAAKVHGSPGATNKTICPGDVGGRKLGNHYGNK